jgi:hypothetical protein
MVRDVIGLKGASVAYAAAAVVGGVAVEPFAPCAV